MKAICPSALSDNGVDVGGTEVAVGDAGSTVAVGGADVAVGDAGATVAVGGADVAVGSICAPPQPANSSTANIKATIR
jgi:hypothetical protein